MTQVDDTTIITTDEDIVLEDEPNEEMGMQEKVATAEFADIEEDQELPEIEVDEWIDLDEQWERDTYFVVFSEEELFRNAYLLYYNESKDQDYSYQQSKLKVHLLHDVIKKLSSQRTYRIPANLYPILEAERKDISDTFKNYLTQYKQLRRKPYRDAEQKLNKLYSTVFDFSMNEEGVFIVPTERTELYIQQELETEPEKVEKKRGRGKRSNEPLEESVPKKTVYDTYIAHDKDELPLPIKGFLRSPYYTSTKVPFYLSELVKWKPANIKDYEKILLEEGKKSISLKKLKEFSSYSYEEVIDGLKELPSVHYLHVLLASFGYYLEELNEEQLGLLLTKLESLRKKEKSRNTNTSTRILWSHYPRKMTQPSEYSIWSLLKTLIEKIFDKEQTTMDEMKDKIQKILREYEAHQEVFSKTTSVPMNIYDIAMQIHDNELTIEEVVETLASMRNEEVLVTYIDFLKGIVNEEWNYVDLIKALDDKHKEWSRMDMSVIPEKRPILTTYDATQEIVRGKRSFPIDQHDDLLDVDVGDDDRDRDYVDISMEDTLEPMVEEVVPFIDESSQDTIMPHVQKSHFTNGQKEVFAYVVRLLMNLQDISELPLNIENCLEDLAKVTSRLSQLEELQQLVPEIPNEDLRKVFDQQVTHIEITDSDVEERFHKGYIHVVQNYRKAIVEAFFFALTWWVIHIQEEYITNPKNVHPTFQPCLPVWAFYGTPMSSSDEKGVAKYLTCVIEYIRQQGSSSIWQIFDSYTEKHLIDKVYKTSKNEFFQSKVTMLKEEWKNKWKEIARRDKEKEVYIEQLSKASTNPQKYRHIYVELLKRLPKILYERQLATKQYIAIPVANSCCAQPLNHTFQAFGDLKGTVLYDHRKLHFGRQAEYSSMVNLGKVSTGEFGTSIVDDTCGNDTLSKLSIKDEFDTLSKRQWNNMCFLIRQPKWVIPTKPSTDETGVTKDEAIESISTSDIRRALKEYQQTIEKVVSNKNKQWQVFTDLLQKGTWNDKIQVLSILLQGYQKDIIDNKTSDWIPMVSKRNIDQVSEWRKELLAWRYPVSLEANVHDMMNYVIMMAVSLPLIPSADGKGLTGRLDGIDLQVLDQRWLNESMDRRIELVSSNRKIQKTPTMKEIQEYYANVREKLKEHNLAEYKSKSIDEIQEIREAKKLGVKKILDTLDNKYTGVLSENMTDTSARIVETDDMIDSEGLAEHRFEGFNADATDIERVD